jgi:leucyl aminopeptidase (aminopeptidase T)
LAAEAVEGTEEAGERTSMRLAEEGAESRKGVEAAAEEEEEEEGPVRVELLWPGRDQPGIIMGYTPEEEEEADGAGLETAAVAAEAAVAGVALAVAESAAAWLVVAATSAFLSSSFFGPSSPAFFLSSNSHA